MSSHVQTGCEGPIMPGSLNIGTPGDARTTRCSTGYQLLLFICSACRLTRSLCHTHFRSAACVGVFVICPFLAGACGVFCNLGLGAMALPVAAGRFAGAAHVDRAQRVCLFCDSTVVLWGMRGILFLIVLPLLPCSHITQAYSQAALTP